MPAEARMLKHVGAEWCVFSKDGTKKLGCFATKAQAAAHLAFIESKKDRADDVFERATAEPVTMTGSDDARHITGYAAVFNQETIIDAGFQAWRERIDKAAFTDTLKTADVRAAINHSRDHVLARTKNQTLMLTVDDHGLKYDFRVPNTTAGRDALALIEDGTIDGSSFKFRVPEGGMEVTNRDGKDGKLPLVTMKRVDLIDVGPVTYPAYPGTSASARMLPDFLGLLAPVEPIESIDESATDEPAIVARKAARASLNLAKAWAPSARS